MEAPAPTIPSIPLAYCPECGYSLHGLPPHGKCPECGVIYDESVAVLWGWGAGNFGNLANARYSGVFSKTSTIIAAVLLTALCIYVRGYFWATLMVTGVVVPALYSAWRTRAGFNRPPRPTQLVITSRGIGQRDGFGVVKVCPWTSRLLVDIERKPENLYRIHATSITDAGMVAVIACDILLQLQPLEFEILVQILTTHTEADCGRVSRVL